MNCPSCGRQPNRFVNGLLQCEGGHEWQGRLEAPGSVGAINPVPITIRGKEYFLTPSLDKHYMVLVSLIALDNPAVDEVLRAFGVILDIGGKRVFPPEE